MKKSDAQFTARLIVRRRLLVAPLLAVAFFPGAQTFAAEVATTPALPNGSASAATAAQGSDNTAMIASGLMAAAMATQCGPKNPMACVMAALSALQAVAAADAGSGSGQSAGANSTTSTSALSSTTPTNLVGTGGAGETLSQVKSQLAAAGAPMSADNSQMTLPDGTSVPLNSSTSSDASLAAAGFSAEQIAKGRADVAAAAASLGMKAGAPAGDAGGGGAGGFGGTYTPAKVAATAGKPRAKPNLSGLTKNLGNDKIGVSADDIFEMITRRYQAKDASGTFIKN